MNQAFSKIWIMIVVIIFIAGGILAYQYWWVPKEEAEKPEEKAPEQVVLEFYQCYIKEREQYKGLVFAIESCNALEENYKQSLLEKELILVDPILWAQDVPPADNLQVGKAVIKNKTASLFVTFSPMWPDHKIKISLLLVDAKWKITNIEDISKEGAPSETTDWKTYKNEEYGYEIKYPKDWNYGPNILRSGPDLVFCPPEFSDPDPDLRCKWESKDGHMPSSLSPIGLFVWKVESFPGKLDEKGVWKDPRRNYIYELSLFNESFQYIYNQMLSTFRFLE